MAGNVWEWTQSEHRSYPYSADDGRNDPNAEGARVWRGGAFGNSAWYARCAFRFRNSPDLGYDYLGFRVVSSP
jgi:formylglycine-generating enzyme required for sulfatase activity